jgi:hypothetical protein
VRYGPEPKLTGLNNGWPFSDGPMEWDIRVEVRDGATWPEIHMVCAREGQSVFCLAPDAALPGFIWNLTGLRARVADHVLKCHADEIADLTYR